MEFSFRPMNSDKILYLKPPESDLWLKAINEAAPDNFERHCFDDQDGECYKHGCLNGIGPKQFYHPIREFLEVHERVLRMIQQNQEWDGGNRSYETGKTERDVVIGILQEMITISRDAIANGATKIAVTNESISKICPRQFIKEDGSIILLSYDEAKIKVKSDNWETNFRGVHSPKIGEVRK